MSEQLFSCDGPPNECGRCEVCQQVALVHLMHDDEDSEAERPLGSLTRRLIEDINAISTRVYAVESLRETAHALGYDLVAKSQFGGQDDGK